MAGNLRFAAKAFPDVLGYDQRSPWTLVPRNWADLSLLRSQRCVLMPQNAWPWAGEGAGARPLARRSALRVASEVSMRSASGVIRIGETIPSIGNVLGSPLPSVLDEGFDAAWERSVETGCEGIDSGGLVSIGSFTTYRGLDSMVDAYRQYRRSGGRLGLTIAGPGSSVIRPSPSPGLVVRRGALPRPRVLKSLREARAVVFPSTVEASPVGVMEADAVARVVLASDIPGHREASARARFFSVGDATELARLFTSVDHEPTPEGPVVGGPGLGRARADDRRRWSEGLAERLRSVTGAGPP